MNLRAYRVEIVWASFALASVLALPLLFDRIWIIALVPVVLALLVGLALAVHRLLRRQVARAVALLTAVVVLVLLAGPGQQPIARVSTYVRFLAERDALDETVAQELRYAVSGQRDLDGKYIVETGPPLRIAFPSGGGLIDNWCGFVFDPSGLVMRANEFRGDFSNWDDPTLAHVKRLFGGDLLHCRHLDGPYYHCCFT